MNFARRHDVSFEALLSRCFAGFADTGAPRNGAGYCTVTVIVV
jgi:hypothetical protein